MCNCQYVPCPYHVLQRGVLASLCHLLPLTLKLLSFPVVFFLLSLPLTPLPSPPSVLPSFISENSSCLHG